MHQVFFNVCVYAKQKINLTWPHFEQAKKILKQYGKLYIHETISSRKI